MKTVRVCSLRSDHDIVFYETNFPTLVIRLNKIDSYESHTLNRFRKFYCDNSCGSHTSCFWCIVCLMHMVPVGSDSNLRLCRDYSKIHFNRPSWACVIFRTEFKRWIRKHMFVKFHYIKFQYLLQNILKYEKQLNHLKEQTIQKQPSYVIA